MLTLAIGFALLTALNVGTLALRSHIALILQNAMHFHMGARLFHHLGRLPLSFFEKRHIGDILSRFQSIEPIRNVLAEGLIIAVIDGIMAIATLILIFVYSAQLALVVGTAFLLYVLLRLLTYQRFRVLNETSIRTLAKRTRTSSRRHAPSRASNYSTGRASAKAVAQPARRDGECQLPERPRFDPFVTMNRAIFGLENIVTVYLAAMLAIEDELSIGMIFAFMAYKLNSLIRHACLWRNCSISACWICTSSEFRYCVASARSGA